VPDDTPTDGTLQVLNPFWEAIATPTPIDVPVIRFHARRSGRLALLNGANLRSAILPDVNLEAADLSYADLHEANLNSANLHEANLSSADLHGADLKSVILTKANLTGTNLANGQLRGAICDLATTWPKDLHPYRTGAQLAATDDEE
jgi:hypothetical protein